MVFTVSLTQSQILTALRSFLLLVLPAGIEVVQGQDNRVPEPIGPDFVTMTPLFRERLAWNIDTYEDTVFTGAIAGETLTVTSVSLGTIRLGATVFGEGIVAGTTITAMGTGVGGIGTYTASQQQTVASQIMAAGTMNSMQKTQFTVQLDVHGPNSGDNVQVISTTFRDGFAFDQIALSGFDMAPLYAETPHQMPFVNGEQQIEQRWVIDIVLQVNPTVAVPTQFAAQLAVLTKTAVQ